MNTSPIRAACAALMAVVAAPAFADTAASARLANMHFELIDLRPKDGIAPSMTFMDGLGSVVSIGMRQDARSPYYSAQATVDSPLRGVSIGHALRDAGAGAAVRGNGSLVGVGLVARSFTMAATGVERTASGIAGLGNDRYGYGLLRFELSPHTKLVWTADANLQVQTAQRYRHYDPAWDGLRYELANASAFMALGQVDESGSFERALGFNVGRAREYDSTGITGHFNVPNSRGRTDQISLVLRNRSDDTFNGALIASTRAYGITSTVPEPETYAMFLGGLAIVGFVVRRRRAKEAQLASVPSAAQG
jgi:PEP-CTERM motif